MKIAYLCEINIDRYDGVSKKIVSQINHWSKLNNQVKLFCIINSDNNISNSSFSKLNNQVVFFAKNKVKDFFLNWLGFTSIYDEVYNSILKFDPDLVYYRSNFVLPFYFRINKVFITTVEINTVEKNEYKIQSTENIKYFLRYVYFLITEKNKFKNTNAFFCVTNEIANELKNKGVKSFVVPNSINIEKDILKVSAKKSGKYNVVFLGTPNLPWHGLDIIVKLSNKIPSIHFHIIGFKSETLDSKNLTTHGYLDKESYINIINECDVAIGSLALFRNKMDEACPLKVREYLSLGIPIIISFLDTAFEPNSYPDWVLRLENNEEKILNSTVKIEDFVKKMKGYRIPKEEVYNFISTSVLEKKRITYLKEVLTRRKNIN